MSQDRIITVYCCILMMTYPLQCLCNDFQLALWCYTYLFLHYRTVIREASLMSCWLLRQPVAMCVYHFCFSVQCTVINKYDNHDIIGMVRCSKWKTLKCMQIILYTAARYMQIITEIHRYLPHVSWPSHDKGRSSSYGYAYFKYPS